LRSSTRATSASSGAGSLEPARQLGAGRIGNEHAPAGLAGGGEQPRQRQDLQAVERFFLAVEPTEQRRESLVERRHQRRLDGEPARLVVSGATALELVAVGGRHSGEQLPGAEVGSRLGGEKRQVGRIFERRESRSGEGHRGA